MKSIFFRLLFSQLVLTLCLSANMTDELRQLATGQDRAVVLLVVKVVDESLEEYGKLCVVKGSPLDGGIDSIDASVLRKLEDLYSKKTYTTANSNKAEMPSEPPTIYIDFINYSEGRGKSISALVAVHVSRGPLDAYANLYQVVYYDRIWSIHLIRKLYIS